MFPTKKKQKHTPTRPLWGWTPWASNLEECDLAHRCQGLPWSLQPELLVSKMTPKKKSPPSRSDQKIGFKFDLFVPRKLMKFIMKNSGNTMFWNVAMVGLLSLQTMGHQFIPNHSPSHPPSSSRWILQTPRGPRYSQAKAHARNQAQ